MVGILFRIGWRAAAVALLALLPGAFPAWAQEDAPVKRRFDLPAGPIVREVPPIDHIERPGRAAPAESSGTEEKSEWEAIWERNATPDAEEVERYRERQREMEANGTNRTEGSSGGYYREPFPRDEGDVIRRRTYVPYLEDGTLQRIPRDTYEPYP